MAESELEFDREEWMKAFKSLTAEQQAMIDTWFATQALIIQHAGIPENEWFGLIGWALEHPNDFSFMDEFMAGGAQPKDAKDDRAAAAADDARRSVGGATAKNVATGPGLKEKATKSGLDQDLYKQFMANKMNNPSPRGPVKKKPLPPKGKT